MAQIISVSIDLTKLDKSKIVEGKNGAKYYNLTINVNDQKDNYGNDASVTIAQTKEEREAKQPRTFIGKGRVIWSNNGVQATQQQVQQNNAPNFTPPPGDNGDDDLTF